MNEKAEQYLGDPVTYTLIELVKDNLENWLLQVSKQHPIQEQPKQEEVALVEEVETLVNIIQFRIFVFQMMTLKSEKFQNIADTPKKTVKKEQLSKAQKRRQWDRCNAGGEQPRGWNWVDIVKHLSQTGSKDDPITS